MAELDRCPGLWGEYRGGENGVFDIVGEAFREEDWHNEKSCAVYQAGVDRSRG
jgi:hypothetical protein